MDLVTHAVVGAATGQVFGRPVAGAIIAIVPDMVLGYHRRARPTRSYDVTHSLLFLSICTAFAWVLSEPALVFWCLLSHIALDIPTHGPEWAPPLLFPYNRHRFSYGTEWELFNESWIKGLFVSTLWVMFAILQW